MADYGITWSNPFFNEMTAIAIVPTQAGLIIAADGRSRMEQDPTQGTDRQQKIFQGVIDTADIAWALTGSVFVGTFSLVDEVRKAMQSTNANITPGCGAWLDLFAGTLRNSVSEARRMGLIAPLKEDFSQPDPYTFATVFMIGYFCY